MRTSKRYKVPEHVGAHFNVSVRDGNGDEWFFHSGTPSGPIASRNTEITAERYRDIEAALVKALDFWRHHPAEEAA